MADGLEPKHGSKILQLREMISQPVLAAFCAGGVAGAVSRTIVSPLERLKILYQIQSAGREAYTQSVFKSLIKIGREEGWKGFMRGNGTNCIRIIPYSAVQFGSYNFYKKVRHRRAILNTKLLKHEYSDSSSNHLLEQN
jgi:solute carrier family 25 (mitochondrial phosphate transporter), member 23/24/25/41